MTRSRIALAVVLASLTAASTAHAGQPFTVGSGKSPHIHVDPASGLAHVVYVDRAADVIRICQVPRGTTACARSGALPPIVIAGEQAEPEEPFILRNPANGELYVTVSQYVQGKTFLYRSTDGGASWSGPAQIYGRGGGTDDTEPVFGPVPGELTFPSWNIGRFVFGARTDGSEATADARLDLPAPTGAVYGFALAPTPDGGLVATADDLGRTFAWRLAPGQDPTDASKWTGPVVVGDGDEARVAGGPGGAYVLSVAGPISARRVEVRRWTGAAFGAPTVLINEQGYINDITVGPSGAVAAIWRANDRPHRLRLGLSLNGGAVFAVNTIAREDAVMRSMDVSLAADNHGFAVYEGDRDEIRLASTDPVRETIALTRKAVNVPGGRIRFGTPASCVPAGSTFPVTLSWQRKRRKGNLFVKIFRTDFYIGTQRVKIDRRAPFRQTLQIANARAGATYVVKARAFIKVRRGRSPKKSVRAVIRVC